MAPLANERVIFLIDLPPLNEAATLPRSAFGQMEFHCPDVPPLSGGGRLLDPDRTASGVADGGARRREP